VTVTIDRARLGRAGFLLAFAVLVGRLLATGQMVKYMAPALDPLSAATAVVLAAMAGLEIWGACRRPARVDHPAEHAVAPRGVEFAVTTLLVLTPVALGLLVAPRALGSGALGGAEVSRLLLTFAPGPAPGAAPARPGAAVPPLEDWTELVSHLRQVGEHGIGRRVSVTGMAARSDALATNELALLRYAIAHCVADARPLALLVVAPAAVALANDQWITVEGVVAIRPREGDRLVAIVAERITPVDEPANPYLGTGF
jgi:uncharacterized repeat protein (TIGR03943 family)